MKYICLMFFLVCLTGCSHKSVPVRQPMNRTLESSHLYIGLQSLDLTEDASTVSSGNDELVLLMYTLDSLTGTSVPVFQVYLVRDHTHRDTTFSIPSEPLNRPGKLTLWLLEMDSERSLAEVESIVRKNQQPLLTAY